MFQSWHRGITFRSERIFFFFLLWLFSRHKDRIVTGGYHRVELEHITHLISPSIPNHQLIWTRHMKVKGFPYIPMQSAVPLQKGWNWRDSSRVDLPTPECSFSQQTSFVPKQQHLVQSYRVCCYIDQLAIVLSDNKQDVQHQEPQGYSKQPQRKTGSLHHLLLQNHPHWQNHLHRLFLKQSTNFWWRKKQPRRRSQW